MLLYGRPPPITTTAADTAIQSSPPNNDKEDPDTRLAAMITTLSNIRDVDQRVAPILGELELLVEEFVRQG
jgi:hypothetical protein